MPAVNPKVIAAGWAAASWIRALRAKWDEPRPDVDAVAAGKVAAANQGRSAANQGRTATRTATATRPAKKK
jgi:hypothetical protein